MIELQMLLKPSGKTHAPTWLVKCHGCGEQYERTGWRKAILACRSCNRCARKSQGPA